MDQLGRLIQETADVIQREVAKLGDEANLADLSRSTSIAYNDLYDVAFGNGVSYKRLNRVRRGLGLSEVDEPEYVRVHLTEDQCVRYKPGKSPRKYKRKLATDLTDEEFETFYERARSSGYGNLKELLRGEGYI